MNIRCTLLICCLAVVGQLKAQKYEFTIAEVRNGLTPEKATKHTIKPGEASWEASAVVLITEVTQADSGKVTLTSREDSKPVQADWSLPDKIIRFNLVPAISKNQSKFDIAVDGKPCGTIIFDLSGKAPGGGGSKDNQEGSPEDSLLQVYVGALSSANFVGNNKFLANLTPIVNLGSVVKLIQAKKVFSWELDVNPYLGGIIDTRDSVSFIPALMLHGRAGLVLNNYLNFDLGKLRLTMMPFGFGLKFLPDMRDSGNVLIQHNIRAGLAIKYDNIFVLSAQLTHGWHNLTSESAKSFQRTFGVAATDIDYIMVGGQFALHGTTDAITNYIFFEWRSLLSKKRYDSFDNVAMLTLGIRKTLELHGGGGAFSANNDAPRRTRRRNVVHGGW